MRYHDSGETFFYMVFLQSFYIMNNTCLFSAMSFYLDTPNFLCSTAYLKVLRRASAFQLSLSHSCSLAAALNFVHAILGRGSAAGKSPIGAVYSLKQSTVNKKIPTILHFNHDNRVILPSFRRQHVYTILNSYACSIGSSLRSAPTRQWKTNSLRPYISGNKLSLRDSIRFFKNNSMNAALFETARSWLHSRYTRFFIFFSVYVTDEDPLTYIVHYPAVLSLAV